jgi:NADH-quinone oxidoreductase subunit A
MTESYASWQLVGILALGALLFAVTPLLLARLWAEWFAPRKPGQEKQSTYECGLVSRGDAWCRFRSEYYIYGIVFLVFDVETVFLLPFAVALTGLPGGAILAMAVFLLLLAEGLVWAWQKGVLTWR